LIKLGRSLNFLVAAFLLGTTLVLSGVAKAESQPKEITIGLIPGGNPENLKKQSLDLAQLLQKELNISVNMYVSKNYAGLVEAMKTKKVDFAFFSSMTFVQAEKEADAKVLLKKVWTGPFYYSAVVVRKDSKYKKVEDLKGHILAFVDNNSASGYLHPETMLRKKNIKDTDFKEIKFSGNHSNSVAILENKQADAIATFSDDAEGKTGAWTKFGKKDSKFRVIWVSDPIPSDPFCVRQDFYNDYPKLTHTLMFTLIDIVGNYKESGRFAEVLGPKDLMPATSRQYDPVREMVKSLNVGIN
jgi:phosphonate transport system substrate-binding protein